MSPIDRLASEAPVLTDGAWGTQLQARGLAPGEQADFWNLTHPEAVQQVASGYVEAGSRVILTNTFQANRIAAHRHPDVDRIADVNRAGVEISRRAAGDRAMVFASMGPTGKLLMEGRTPAGEIAEAFSEQAAALASGKPDAIVVETMSELAEAALAVAAARATGLPVVACMVFDSGKRKDRTMMGVSPEEAATALGELGADAIGANCGTGIDAYLEVCQRLITSTSLPVWIKPNAGLPELVDGEVLYRTTPDEFADRVEELARMGATFVGGCCGTTPDFVRAMAARLER